MRVEMLQALRRTAVLSGGCLRRQMAVLSIDDSLNGLTEDQIQLRETAKTFAQAELAPHAYEIDRDNNFSQLREFWRKCGEMGFHGITCPEEYGGEIISTAVEFYSLRNDIFYFLTNNPVPK